MESIACGRRKEQGVKELMKGIHSYTFKRTPISVEVEALTGARTTSKDKGEATRVNKGAMTMEVEVDRAPRHNDYEGDRGGLRGNRTDGRETTFTSYKKGRSITLTVLLKPAHEYGGRLMQIHRL